MAMSPGAMVHQDHHLVGDRAWRYGSLVRVIEGESVVQCCNRSRNSTGQQPQPLPEATSSDPMWRSVGRRCCWVRITGGGLQGDGHVMERDGRQGPSPSRRPGPAAAPGAGDRGEKELQCCNRPDTPTASSPILFLELLEQRAWTRCGVLPAGGVAELGAPVGACSAIAKSPRAR